MVDLRGLDDSLDVIAVAEDAPVGDLVRVFRKRDEPAVRLRGLEDVVSGDLRGTRLASGPAADARPSRRTRGSNTVGGDVVEPLSGATAGRIAGLILKVAGPELKRRALGADEQRAIDRALRRALEEVSADVEGAEPALEFFADPEVATAMVDVALDRRPPDVARLRDRLLRLGFDPVTFPVDLPAFVSRLVSALADELGREAARGDSAIFNEVALAQLDALRRELAEAAGDGAQRHFVAGTAPPLPALVLGREEAMRELKERFGIADPRADHAELQVITAVRGWPGVGKTTVAAALAHDVEVAAAFPDGVLWASLGEAGRGASELRVWARALGAERLSDAGDIEELSARLRALLRDRRMLLVIDDVWEAAHAAPFRIGGRGCAHVITTRIPTVARALVPSPGDVYWLDVLSEESSLELLRRLAPGVVDERPEEARELVGELEGLPLALQVAGHLLEAEASLGFGVAELLSELRSGALVLASTAPPDRRDAVEPAPPTVAALLKNSTDRLTPEDRERFALLGAFASKPATFDVDALAAVWQEEDPRPAIRRLADRGLLEPAGGGRFGMHALLAAHAGTMLDE